MSLKNLRKFPYSWTILNLFVGTLHVFLNLFVGNFSGKQILHFVGTFILSLKLVN
jgi:hypothetical protein